MAAKVESVRLTREGVLVVFVAPTSRERTWILLPEDGAYHLARMILRETGNLEVDLTKLPYARDLILADLPPEKREDFSTIAGVR